MQALKELLEKQEERLLKILQLSTAAYEASQAKNIKEQESIEALRETLIHSGDKTYQHLGDLIENSPGFSGESVTAYFEEKKNALITLLQKIISVDQLRAKVLQSELSLTKNEILHSRINKSAANKYETASQSYP